MASKAPSLVGFAAVCVMTYRDLREVMASAYPHTYTHTHAPLAARNVPINTVSWEVRLK